MLTLDVKSENMFSISCEEMCQVYYQTIYQYVSFLIYGWDIHERDVADLTQETFYKAVRGYPHLTHDEHICAWLKCLARNVVFDHLRSLRRHKSDTLPLSEITHLSDQNMYSDPYQVCVRDVLSEQGESAWLTLRPKYREVLGLLAEGYRASEVAEILGYSSAEVYGIIREARKSFIRRYRRARLAQA
jgi:RNA polymerase sigma factor (sigma-70 family)